MCLPVAIAVAHFQVHHRAPSERVPIKLAGQEFEYSSSFAKYKDEINPRAALLKRRQAMNTNPSATKPKRPNKAERAAAAAEAFRAQMEPTKRTSAQIFGDI